jgi:periplasmic copper chaperone A
VSRGLRLLVGGLQWSARAASTLYMCVLLGACGQNAAPVEVSDAWAPATPPNASVGAAYLQIEAREGDTLVAATAPIATRVEIHQTSHEQGMMKMRQLASLAIAPGQPTRLEPSGTHFMLIDLNAPLTAGESFPMTLRFEKAGEITADVAVMAPSATHEHH